MLFEVLRSDGTVVMHTSEESCIPVDDLDNMAAAGYKFRRDGKIVTVATIRRNASISPCDKPIESSLTTVSRPRKVRPVYCIETDTMYSSMSAAGRALGIDPAAISYAIQVSRPTTSGYSFSLAGGETS